MRALIFLPYFGPLNSYFKYWLSSCGTNPQYNWLILTDNDVNESVPDNVTIVKSSLSELKLRFEAKLGIKIKLEKAYKLCDCKAFYGFLFSEYLDDYDFWGYCDCDLVFGDLSKFVSEEMLQKHDKILRTGHFSLIRNKKEINELFLKYATYKMVLKSPAIYGYDESIGGYHLGFAGELVENGYSFYQNDSLVADIDFRYYTFHVVSNPEKSCVFLYDHGRIYRIDRTQEGVKQTEMMYIHLQKRSMTVHPDVDLNKYIIAPNSFLPYSEELLDSEDFWNNVTTEKCDYFNRRKEKISAVKRDLLRFVYEPQKLDSILYRFNLKK